MAAPKLSSYIDGTAIGILQQCFLFKEADEEALCDVVSQLEEVHVKKDEPIVLENEISDHVYFVKSGTVEIVSYVAELKQVNRLAVLRAGDHFSEFSVLNRSTKSGSAFALEDCELLRIHGDDFMAILRRYPEITKNLVLNLAKINQSVAQSHSFVEYFKPELIEVNREILNLIPLPSWEKFEVLPLNYKSGVLTVALKNPYNLRFFEFLRSQSGKARPNVYLIGDKDFQKVLVRLKDLYSGQQKPPSTRPSPLHEDSEPDLISLVKVNPLFAGLPAEIQERLLDYFEEHTYAAGDEIFAPDTESEYLYLIHSGEVEISQPMKDSPANRHVVSLGRNHSFSEISLLTGTVHHHQAKATVATKIFTLRKEVFFELLKSVDFSIPLAQVLAARLKVINHQVGLEYFQKSGPVDFKGLEKLIPLSIIEEYQILPLMLEDNELTLGLVNPESDEIYSVVARHLMDYRITLKMISANDYKQWLMQFKEAVRTSQGQNQSQAASRRATLQLDPSQTVEKILSEGFASRASDIHFEPDADAMNVRFRIDGVLQEWEHKIPKPQASEVVNRIKVLAEMDISNSMIPQDGQLRATIRDLEVRCRVSTLPTKKGEKAVLRVIRDHGSVVPLNMLAPDQRVVKILRAISLSTQGLFLVTGPTGSGKSTTLYSMLNELNRVGINVVTLEDPVEMEIPGLTQVEMRRKSGLTFPIALRSVLRQDPDVIMVGEIRDEESAKIVFEAAITGHLVLSTLHTNHSLDVTSRLKDLGITPATISAGLLGVTSQRLVRATCKKCIAPRETTEFERQIFIDYLNMERPPATVMEGQGCPRCKGTGYLDRLPVFEIWRNTEQTKKILLNEDHWDHLESAAREEGFERLIEFGLRMVLAELTTIAEVKRCLSAT